MPDTPAPASIADATKRRPVRPRHAASLVIVRPGASGPEVLMGMRGAKHRFMPNRLVFPGGRVDPADHAAQAAAPLAPHTRALLERSATPRLAHAIGIAVARELNEETGLSLGDPPTLDGLHYLMRAITPTTMPMRFHARFLMVEAERVSGTLAGSGELENLRYYAIAEALALDLADITELVLRYVLEVLAMSPQERIGRQQTPFYSSRRWRME
ncbi:MAG: NUDIX hydrolase [Proteobacteria bacterium]|nr:NUDIX hydrolase [Pseudomonadota bacterium]